MMEMVPVGAIVVTVAFLIASQRSFKMLRSKLGKDPLFKASSLEAFLPRVLDEGHHLLATFKASGSL